MKRWLLLAVLLLVSSILTACGSVVGSKDVVKDLGQRMEKMKGYKMNALLTLQTGHEPQTYNVEVWHNKPDFYRVSLTSKERDITQIILRNEEGVFVLTPHLGKSFRFQSSWPDNHGQVYLYESLLKSILADATRVMNKDNNMYVFEVKADYQNRSLSSQRITLAEDYAPVKVEVMDNNKNVMVTVEFSNFEADAKFDDDSFSKDRNMKTAMLTAVPTLGEQGKKASSTSTDSFGVIEPSYIPAGLTFSKVERVKREEGDQIILKYSGERSFTLFEERPQAVHVSYPSGEVVDLGFSVAILTGDEKKTMIWTHNGVEFLLTGDIPREEMIAVAKSTFQQVGK